MGEAAEYTALFVFLRFFLPSPRLLMLALVSSFSHQDVLQRSAKGG